MVDGISVRLSPSLSQLKCTEGRKEVDDLNGINGVNEALRLSLD